MSGFIWGIVAGFSAGVLFSLILGDILGRRLRKRQAHSFLVVHRKEFEEFMGQPMQTNPEFGGIRWKPEDEP
jgi:hypothetical protein